MNDLGSAEGAIKQLLRAVVAEFPSVHIDRIAVKRPTDDDNVWFVTDPNAGKEIQIGSMANGRMPFIMEFESDQIVVDILEVAISIIGMWLHRKGTPEGWAPYTQSRS